MELENAVTGSFCADLTRPSDSQGLGLICAKVHLYGISFQSSQTWIASQSVTADRVQCAGLQMIVIDTYEGTAEAVYRGNSYHCHELRGTMPDPYAVDINS